MMSPEIIVIGASYGGLSALQTLLPVFPADFPIPVLVVQHRTRDAGHGLCEYLQRRTRLSVVEPNDKDSIAPGHVYLAPPDYHLLVEAGGFALSVDAPVAHARPSIDVLFESAADAYRERAIAVILTGTNADGAAGVKRVKAHGGYTIVQDPNDSVARQMPDAAIAAAAPPDRILPLAEIGSFLVNLCHVPQRNAHEHG